MNNRYSLISADSHVVEPAGVFVDHIEAKYRDRAPKIVRDSKGLDTFFSEGNWYGSPGLMCGAGRRDTGKTLEDVYPGSYDPHARLKEIAADGIDAEVLYTSVGMRIYAMQDAELRRACFAAYNNWLAGFCSAYPDRFKGIAMVDLTDVGGAVAEMRRARKIGLSGVMISDDPARPELYSSMDLDPFWAVAEELQMPVSLHVATGAQWKMPEAYTYISVIFSPLAIQRALVMMVFGGVFLRFPKLKVVSVEGEASWAISVCQRMDYLFGREHTAFAREYPIKGKGMLPSEYFHRNIAMTMIWDRPAIQAHEYIGTEAMMWSTDYPHRSSTWPKSKQVLEGLFQGMPDDVTRKIKADNVAALYGF